MPTDIAEALVQCFVDVTTASERYLEGRHSPLANKILNVVTMPVGVATIGPLIDKMGKFMLKRLLPGSTAHL